MTMTEEKEGPPGPDQDVPDLTGGVGSTPEDAPPPTSQGASGGEPSSALVKVGVPAIPRGWAGPKARPQHRRRRRFPWAAVALCSFVAAGASAVAWALASEAPAPAPPAETAPADIPRLDKAMGRPAEPSRTVIATSSARVALFDIPALDIHETLAEGTDPAAGPILWPNTPWPGGPGRAVVALWADLSTLRPGHEVLVGEGAGYARWRVATVRQVNVERWAEVARQSIVPELALVEAASFGGRTTRTLVIAWRVP